MSEPIPECATARAAIDLIGRYAETTPTLAEFRALQSEVAALKVKKATGYQFKVAPELLWGVGTAAGTVLLQALTDVEKISDYRAWLVGAGAALVRAVIGALLSQAKPKPEPPAAGGQR